MAYYKKASGVIECVFLSIANDKIMARQTNGRAISFISRYGFSEKTIAMIRRMINDGHPQSVGCYKTLMDGVYSYGRIITYANHRKYQLTRRIKAQAEMETLAAAESNRVRGKGKQKIAKGRIGLANFDRTANSNIAIALNLVVDRSAEVVDKKAKAQKAADKKKHAILIARLNKKHFDERRLLFTSNYQPISDDAWEKHLLKKYASADLGVEPEWQG